MSKPEDPPFPLGVPTSCFAHLDDGPKPSATSASDDGGNKVVIDGRPNPVEGVFDSRLDKDDDIFRELLEVTADDSARPVPLRTFVEDAVSVCLILTGTFNSSKRLLFQGPEESDESLGLLGWVISPVFQLLRDKSFGMHGFYEYQVDLSFYELYDEMVTDLLQPENQNLNVKLHPMRGFEVEGLSKTPILSNSDGVRAIASGKRNRRTQVMQNGPAQESSSAVLELSLTQREGDSPDQYTYLHSQLVLVEVASTHKLIQSPDDLRLKQGPTLNRSLLAFREVCKALSSEKQIRFAPFSEGKLTEVLQGFLGGNAIVLCLACLSRSDRVPVNMATMSLVSHLQSSMHYPVANTELIQGLVMKYRLLLLNFIEVGAGGRGNRARADGAAEGQRMRILEGQLLQARLEGNEFKEDAAKVYKMLELFKGKYMKLVEDKANQSRELITAEEGKLEVTRLLLDLKLEHSKLVEKFEGEKYVVASELLAAKNAVVELEMRLQESDAKLFANQQEAESATKEKEDFKGKILEMEKKTKDLQAMFTQEESKAIEMGTELLTLVNQKSHLEKARVELERQGEDLSRRLGVAEESLTRAQDEAGALKSELGATRQRADALEIVKGRLELDLQQAKMAWEKKSFEADKGAISRVQQREEELLKQQMQASEEIRKLEAQNQTMAKEQKELKAKVKQAERRVEKGQDDLKRKSEKLLEEEDEKAEVVAELNALRENFREKMAILGGPGGGGRASRRRQNKGGDGDRERDGRGQKSAIDELLASYKETEERAVKDAEELRRKVEKGVLVNRALIDRYQELRGTVEDLELGGIELPPNLPPEEKLVEIGQESGYVGGSTGGNSKESSKIAEMKERLRSMAAELSAEQEKVFEGAEDSAEIQRKLAQVEAENETLRQQAGTQSGNAAGEEQLNAIKSMLISNSVQGKGDATSSERVAQAEAERDQALQEIMRLREENRRLAFNAGNVDSGNNNKMIIKRLETVERRNAELLSKNALLETEINTFKIHLQQTVTRYKETIARLQEEIKQLRRGA